MLRTVGYDPVDHSRFNKNVKNDHDDESGTVILAVQAQLAVLLISEDQNMS